MGNIDKKVAFLTDQVEKFTDPFSVGDVITWRSTVNYNDREYQYAAVKTDSGWATTGADTARSTLRTLAELVSYYFGSADRKVSKVRVASAYRKLEV